MAVISFADKTPQIAAPHFIAPDAWVIGDVTIAGLVSIFFHAVLRGDIEPISVGEGSNIQEHAMLHTSRGLGPCTVGKNVTIGHRAIIHGCTIEDSCIIGMGSVILDGAVIGKNSIVGAQALVESLTQNGWFPPPARAPPARRCRDARSSAAAA